MKFGHSHKPDSKHSGAISASNSNEGVADRLPHVTNDVDGCTVRKLERSTSLNDLAKDNEKNVQDLESPNSHSCGEMESFREPVFYMDKSVTECELPELIVCYKENTYHVKDICIDEGVHSHDRILFESDVGKSVRSFLPPKEDRNSELLEESKNSVIPIPDVLKSSAENYSDERIVNRCGSSQESDSDEDIDDICDSKDLRPAGDVKDDATEENTNDVSRKLFLLGDLLSMHNVGTKNSLSKSAIGNEIDAEKESFQGSSAKAALANPEEANGGTAEEILTGADFVSASEESQNGCGEGISGNPTLVSASEKAHDKSEEASLASPDGVSALSESTKISTAEKSSYNSMVETGSITFDFDASAPGASGKEEPLQIGDSQRIETPGMSRLEDAPRQSVSSQFHSGLGESSLLQTEWDRSPVRMAKADRRHYRKHKWKQGLLCCRF
ncbi:uncharacterized protein LOC18045192 [Citrus clementina]|uniref:uncharacterized protein LOC18045192 n=1 Tax=Citrus clementina TaxID=85681 RepID=UPI000CECED7C|nr:uncharacterized protein LOC18045192 [Citrus x clementina]